MLPDASIALVRPEILQVASGDAMTVDFPIVPTTLGQLDIQVSARSTAAADAVKRKITVEVSVVCQMGLLDVIRPPSLSPSLASFLSQSSCLSKYLHVILF